MDLGRGELGGARRRNKPPFRLTAASVAPPSRAVRGAAATATSARVTVTPLSYLPREQT